MLFQVISCFWFTFYRDLLPDLVHEVLDEAFNDDEMALVKQIGKES